MKLIITGSLLFLLPFLALSQSSNLGNWYIYFGNKTINNSWNWHHEVQYRNYNFIGDLEQLLLRTGIGYNLSDNNNNVLLGYGYVLSENYLAGSNEKAAVKEHRIYQQFITRQAFGRVNLQHRYRFEQRFVADNFKMRFRYFISLNLPLNNHRIAPKTYYLSAYNEVFLNTQSAVFDRNRLYGGLGYQLNTRLKMELGYMNQFFEKSRRDQLNMIAFFNF